MPSAQIAAIITQLEQHHEHGPITLDSQQRSLAARVLTFLHDVVETGDTRQLSHTGFYLSGPPGRGKTWLMQRLFKAASFPTATKRQVHFHDFFRRLEQQLGAQTSTRQAIDATLEHLLGGAKLFFFDELHVHDPGSAALLNRLLAAIAEQGIPTLITSNYEPEELLPDAAFHHVIEPSIAVLRDRFTILTLDGGIDYRRQRAGSTTGFGSGRWITIAPHQNRSARFEAAGLIEPQLEEACDVLDGHRMLKALAIRGRHIWFRFADLLETRSATSDFIELATNYTTWVLTDVPRLSQMDPAARQRFVTLIDVLSDRDIPVHICSSITREKLVDITDPPPDLFRTVSRLALLSNTP